MSLSSGEAAAQDVLFPDSVPTNGQTMRLVIGDNSNLEFVWIEKLQAWIGKHPVTHSEFHFFQPHHIGSEDYADPSDSGQKPISNISFKDASNYATWVNAQVRHCLPSNVVVSLPYASDLFFLRSQCRWTDEDQIYTWLKCYGLNCPPVPMGPLLTIRNIAGAYVSASERLAVTSKARMIAEPIEFDPRKWEWTTEREQGLQVANDPSLMAILRDKLRDKTTFQYSDSIYIDTLCSGALLCFRLVIRQ